MNANILIAQRMIQNYKGYLFVMTQHNHIYVFEWLLEGCIRLYWDHLMTNTSTVDMFGICTSMVPISECNYTHRSVICNTVSSKLRWHLSYFVSLCSTEVFICTLATLHRLYSYLSFSSRAFQFLYLGSNDSSLSGCSEKEESELCQY